MNEFILHGESIDLCALLKATGLCTTGGEAKGMIRDGLVRVDGEIESRLRRKIGSGMRVEVATGEKGKAPLIYTINLPREY